jgi:hypothetical protein
MVFPSGWTSLAGITYPDGLSMAPSKEAIDQVVEAFRAQGLTLHIDPIHNAIPGRQVIIPDFYAYWMNPSAACVGPDAVSFMALKAQYFQPPGNHPWHYAIFGFNYGTPDTSANGDACPPDPVGLGHIDPTSTGFSELPGFNFILAVGSFIETTGIMDPPVNTVSSFFMHELGHNFGLMHGGVISAPGGGISLESFFSHKPNYISVMSYSYNGNGIYVATQPGSATFLQCNADRDCPAGSHCTTGYLGGDRCYRLDYSSETLLNLTEPSLDETLGVGGPPGDTDIVLNLNFGPGCYVPGGPNGGLPFLFQPSHGPIDWNCDGTIESNVAADIDNDDGIPDYLLHGFDDWTYVKQQLQIPPEVIESGPKRTVYEPGPRNIRTSRALLRNKS